MHALSVVNHTKDTLTVTLSAIPIDAGNVNVIHPSSRATFSSAKSKCLATLILGTLSEKQTHGTGWSTILEIKGRPRHGWELVKEDPLTVYRAELTKKHCLLVAFPKRSLASFLANMPSSLPLSSLMLPGTHDSVAFYGWPISQCQDLGTPLATQFASGIRVLDIRLAVINGDLISYHGIYPERLPFVDILEAVNAFLTSPEGRTETLIMSIKQEDQASVLFSQLVHSAVYNGPGGRGMWFLENRIPILGEVRGKVVLFSRFGGDGVGWEGGLEGLGIHPTTWPDSEKEGFEWWLKGTNVKTHDWYSVRFSISLGRPYVFTREQIPSVLAIPEKASLASHILLRSDPAPPFPVLSITFLSASSFPLALPPAVACGFGWPSWGLGVEGVNSRVGRWLLGHLSGVEDTGRATEHRDGHSVLDTKERTAESRLRGWCMMDYFKEPVDMGLVRLIVECNYRARRAGEEGWPFMGHSLP